MTTPHPAADPARTPVPDVDTALDGIDPPVGAEWGEPGEDPQDCPACVAVAELCAYHRGWADGWDQLASLVGAFAQNGTGDDH